MIYANRRIIVTCLIMVTVAVLISLIYIQVSKQNVTGVLHRSRITGAPVIVTPMPYVFPSFYTGHFLP
jgi:hypothetical protein